MQGGLKLVFRIDIAPLVMPECGQIGVGGRKAYVIEVNDNPSIEAGYEDRVLKDELYFRVMEVFLERIEKSKAPWTAS